MCNLIGSLVGVHDVSVFFCFDNYVCIVQTHAYPYPILLFSPEIIKKMVRIFAGPPSRRGEKKKKALYHMYDKFTSCNSTGACMCLLYIHRFAPRALSARPADTSGRSMGPCRLSAVQQCSLDVERIVCLIRLILMLWRSLFCAHLAVIA